ncbi:MAG: hypothetical protein K8F91_04935 [Candidatus Obscuribacterales bacterium]|nr:hypothetical protein [Candidatus Obscuribacterales bacterium]
MQNSSDRKNFTGARVEDLAVFLKAGMNSEFERQFRQTAELVAAEGLANLVNQELRAGPVRSDLKVMVARCGDHNDSVTVIDSSRLFGKSWPVCRQTFCL